MKIEITRLQVMARSIYKWRGAHRHFYYRKTISLPISISCLFLVMTINKNDNLTNYKSVIINSVIFVNSILGECAFPLNSRQMPIVFSSNGEICSFKFSMYSPFDYVIYHKSKNIHYPSTDTRHNRYE